MEPIEPRPGLDHRTSDLNEAIGILADRIDIVRREVDGGARCVNRALLVYQRLTGRAHRDPGRHIIRLLLDSLPHAACFVRASVGTSCSGPGYEERLLLTSRLLPLGSRFRHRPSSKTTTK